MKAIRVCFSLATVLAIPTWLVFSGTTFVGLAQTPSSRLTLETFFEAVHGNDTNSVSKMLEADTNLVRAAYYGRFPLTVAAGDGSLPMVQLLLKYGADVNVQSDTWNTSNVRLTALDAAIWMGNTNLAKVLLEAGANPNLQSMMGENALHYAFQYDRTGMAEWLLDYGADAFLAKLIYGQVTPFELAITKGDGKLVPRMLGQAGAGPSALKPARPLPWLKTPAENRKAAADMIAERGPKLLSAAAQRGELEAVEALLKAGVSAKTNVLGELPLMQAFAVSQAAAARVASLAPEHLMKIRDLLITNGADYDAFAATALADTNRAARLLAADRNVVQARDREGQTPLHWAVLYDQLPLTSFWLQAGSAPAATNHAGQTPLHVAATKGLTEQVAALLAANTPTDIRDTNGWTPLDAAIQAKQADAIHLLMAKSPATPHSERGLATPLHEAAASGNVAALAALLDTETNLEARNELGLTPLLVAGQAGQLGAAAFLIDHGADVNARDPEGNTVLHEILLSRTHWVKGRPSDAWVERRKENPSQEKFWRVYNTPSGYTSPRELAASVAFFLACGTDPAATNHAGQTILQLVTADSTMLWDYDRNAILPLLQQTGDGLNARDAEGNTALHRLCTGFYDVNKVESMASLLASGADVNATNNLGQTPLHLTAQDVELWDDDNPPVNSPFRLLIYYKANVNAQDSEGMTPLHVLALSGGSYRAQASKALLDAGANPNLHDKQGRTPLLVLAGTNTYSRKEVTRALLDGSANPNLPDEQGRTPAHLFLSGEWPWQQAAECIDMLVAAGADLSAKDHQGRTPLHYLATLGSQSPMFFLRGIGDTFILAKVDFNVRDNDGNTPLHLAAKTGTRDVYDWLIQHGSNPDATNQAGETPRRLATRSTGPANRFQSLVDTELTQAVREGNLESVAAILKSAPELLNQTNRFGQTPLLLAAQTRNTNIVDFLDAQGARWDPVSAIVMDRTEILRKMIAQQPQLASDGSLLVTAVSSRKIPAAELLLTAGSDLKATDIYGRSALGIALFLKQDGVAELLTKQGAVKNIFDAVYAGDTGAATALIERDKSLLSVTNSTGVSVVEIAVASGNDQVLKLALDKGTSPNFRNSLTGKSLLDAAAEFDRTNAAELLLQHRAKPDVTDNLGFSPVHTATLRGSTAVLEMLFKQKVAPDLRTHPQGAARPSPSGAPPVFDWRRLASPENTPLHLAALSGQTNVITLLLKWGASVNATNADGMTPLDLANQIGRQPLPQMGAIDRRFPFTRSANPIVNPVLHRSATIALLQQAGGKPGERSATNGMAGFGPPGGAPFPAQGPAPVYRPRVLQTGDDYHTQGCIDYNTRRFTNALADFRKSCELGSSSHDYSYFRIWLIRARLGETAAATQELAAYLERRKAQKPDDWPCKVGRFLAGQLPETDFLRAADDSNLQTSKEQHCEAWFYIGSKHLFENDRMAAIDNFKKCLTTNLINFEEYQSASVEMMFLQFSQTNP